MLYVLLFKGYKCLFTLIYKTIVGLNLVHVDHINVKGLLGEGVNGAKVIKIKYLLV